MYKSLLLPGISSFILAVAGGIPEKAPDFAGSRKSVYAPAVATAPVLDGRMTDQVWQQAESFEDFSIFRPGNGSAAATRVKVLRYGGNLYIGVECEEPDGVCHSNTGDGIKVWQDDLLEIFFATRSPELWSVQFGIAAGGGRFCNAGYDNWEAVSAVTDNNWSTEIRIPVSMLHTADGGISFNLCRQRLNAGQYLTWSPVQNSFHELERYGEMLFFSYSDTLAMRYGGDYPAELSRMEYEKIAAENAVAPQDIAHGPWLSYPTENSVTISWQNAGITAGIIEYRKKDSGEWQAVIAECKYGVLPFKEFHRADLEGLEPGCTYEYRICSIIPGGGIYFTRNWSFTTLDKDRQNFSFAVFTDIHDQEWVLKELWHNSSPRKADFCVNLGDMSSAMNGKDIFYHGYLDTEVDLFATTVPLVWGRGNHELRGEGAKLYAEYMHNPAGTAYYAFEHGGVLFIVLDGFTDIGPGDPYAALDHKNYLADERQWLEELSKSEIYKNARYRVVLAHFPPWDTASVAGQSAEFLIKDILDSTDEERKIHLYIAGHTHRYSRIMPYAEEIITGGKSFKSTGGPAKLPFPVIINDGPGGNGIDGSITWVHVSDSGLSTETLAPDGSLIDTFTVK